jgi:HAD superfamily hydrolase (TIGR01509 family)
MIPSRLIIFDLDGVLLDAKEIHYNALNKALAQIDYRYIISRKEHLFKYDGLSTKTKLDFLKKDKQLPEHVHEQVWKNKQLFTYEMLSAVEKNDSLVDKFKQLKELGYTIAVCSNSIRQTVNISLLKLGLIPYVDFFLSNEDVSHSKPSPEIFLRAMIIANVSPKNTIIVEDSYVGRSAAEASGARLFPVSSPKDLNDNSIISFAYNFLNKKENSMKWKNNKLNILVPMAGRGSRFEKAGYTFPKPLIDVEGKPMIQLVVENINIEANYIFLVLKEHYSRYSLETVLNNVAPGCKIIQIDSVTEGAACTTLLAKEYIDNEQPLLIANSDQYVEWESSKFMYSMEADGIDGGILTFTSTHPKWSFCKTDEMGVITEVAEKNPISDKASVGIYYWSKGQDYVKYAENMISKNLRVNNEFYICPVYNEAIADGKIFKTYTVDKMWGLGTPEDLDLYLKK